MLYVYLYTARYLLVNGYKSEALRYLAMALGECNRSALASVTAAQERKHVMRALSYARRD